MINHRSKQLRQQQRNSSLADFTIQVKSVEKEKLNKDRNPFRSFIVSDKYGSTKLLTVADVQIQDVWGETWDGQDNLAHNDNARGSLFPYVTINPTSSASLNHISFETSLPTYTLHALIRRHVRGEVPMARIHTVSETHYFSETSEESVGFELNNAL